MTAFERIKERDLDRLLEEARDVASDTHDERAEKLLRQLVTEIEKMRLVKP